MVKIDCLTGTQWGDEGKGKVAKSLLEKNKYDAVCKVQGGSNAGHACWVDGKKYTAHLLTSGVYYTGCDVIIGPGCAVNPKKFLDEYEIFDKRFNLTGRVFISPRAHIVTAQHIREDSLDTAIGTTHQGIGPCYADKYRRTGIRAESIPELEPFIRDVNLLKYDSVLLEGSQGWELDLDNGAYPHVTSSHIHPAFGFASFGVSMQHLHKVYGVGKVYLTYVGTSETMVRADREDEMLLRDVGQEFGETTGRPRKVGYLDLIQLTTACKRLGINTLVLNKLDILEGIDMYKLWGMDGKLHIFNEVEEFTSYIFDVMSKFSWIDNMAFSASKEKVEAFA